MSDTQLNRLAVELGKQLLQQNLRVVVAESCTGGWLAKVITDVAGSSGWFDRGFVTYTNRAKQEMLGVSREYLERYGAVSEVVVREMAQGALLRSDAGISIAISGIAGPAGGGPDKPVGTVCFGWAGLSDGTETALFDGDREAVRRQSVARACRILLDCLVRE